MPLVSVIIPVRNGERTIKESILSVLQQSFQDFEVLIIDDSSTDDTQSIVQLFSDKRIRFIAANASGPSACRNRGIIEAKGHYVGFLDCDDIWKPEKLEAQVQMFKNQPESAMVYSWTDYIDSDGAFICEGSHPNISGRVFPQLLLYDFIESCSNVLVKKSILSLCKGFDESLYMAEDWDLWLRIARESSVSLVSQVHVLYRLSESARSTADLVRLKESCTEVLNRHYRDASDSLKPFKKKSLRNLDFYILFRRIEHFFTEKKHSKNMKHVWLFLLRSVFLRRQIRECVAVPVHFIVSIFRKKTDGISKR